MFTLQMSSKQGRPMYRILTLSAISIYTGRNRDLIPVRCTRHYNHHPSKIVHTNLHTEIIKNRDNRPHNHYVNAYFTQITNLICKTRCYRLTLPKTID